MNLLITLPLGVAFILLVFFALRRGLQQSPNAAALITAVVTLVIYGGVSVWQWQGADVLAIHLAIYLITIYALAIIGASRAGNTGKKQRLHWAPMLLIGFFLVVVLVDSVFILLAQQGVGDTWVKRLLPEPRGGGAVRSVFPGVVSHDFREKENQFNEYQAMRDMQQQRNWQVRIGWDKPAVSGETNRLLLRVTTQDESALLDAEISGRLLYAADAGHDQSFSMQQTLNELYQAELDLPRAGRWELVLFIRRGEEVHEVRADTTIQAKPD